jgi:hypothetical protein
MDPTVTALFVGLNANMVNVWLPIHVTANRDGVESRAKFPFAMRPADRAHASLPTCVSVFTVGPVFNVKHRNPHLPV